MTLSLHVLALNPIENFPNFKILKRLRKLAKMKFFSEKKYLTAQIKSLP